MIYIIRGRRFPNYPWYNLRAFTTYENADNWRNNPENFIGWTELDIEYIDID